MKKNRLILLIFLLLISSTLFLVLSFQLNKKRISPFQSELYPIHTNLIRSAVMVLDLGKPGTDFIPLGHKTDKNHIAVKDFTSTTFFDIDNDGYSELISWPNSNDGLIVMDQDGDGYIKNQNELFGRNTLFRSGFIKLMEYDSDKDNAITDKDEFFKKIQVWIDKNGDAKSDLGELKSLAELGIDRINLNFIRTSGQRNDLNLNHTKGTFIINGKARDLEEVIPLRSDLFTRYESYTNLNVQALFLPTLKGFGNLPDLHIALSENKNLLDKLILLVKNSSDGTLSNIERFDLLIENILFEWAGCSNVDKKSRGNYVDAQKLIFTEKFSGSPFGYDRYYPYSDPQNEIQAQEVELLYQKEFMLLRAYLIFQTGYLDIFEKRPVYNLINGSMYATSPITKKGIEQLKKSAQSISPDKRKAYWEFILNLIFQVRPKQFITQNELSILSKEIHETTGLSGMEIIESIPSVKIPI